MNAFNPAQFRAQFPALTDAGVYLDSAATALKPQAVIDATHQFYSLSAGNVHRSQFAEAQRLTARYEAARGKVAQWLNAPDDASIVWTRGTTEAINMVAQCYARPRLQPGDEIIVSEAEHHANLVPWLMVAQQTGAKIVKLPLNALFLPTWSVCLNSSRHAAGFWPWDRCRTSRAAARTWRALSRWRTRQGWW
ncbi:cysteine sulfinate desulfinase [Citrobacter koseri]|nr:cysteine sulfinate desulfinase [Citrobacter koseri]